MTKGMTTEVMLDRREAAPPTIRSVLKVRRSAHSSGLWTLLARYSWKASFRRVASRRVPRSGLISQMSFSSSGRWYPTCLS